jgi:hypothetical protein
MNKEIILVFVVSVLLIAIYFLPNYSLYDYIKPKSKKLEVYAEKNEGVLVVCKKCNGSGLTEQDVNLLTAEASFAIWYNIHVTSHKCEVCSKDKSCELAQQKYDDIMKKYKEIGPKIEMANCPGCMGAGQYKQYKGYRVGREKL